MAEAARQESAEEAALRVCNELKIMILTTKKQAAAAISRSGHSQANAHSSAPLSGLHSSHSEEIDGSRSGPSGQKLQEDLEETKVRLRQALSDLGIAQREIEAKDKQIVALLRRMPAGTVNEQELRERLMQEQATSNKLRQELSSMRGGNSIYATYDA